MRRARSNPVRTALARGGLYTLALGLLVAGCPPSPPVAAPPPTPVPTPTASLSLETASLPVVILQSAAELDSAHLDPLLATFSGAGRRVQNRPLAKVEQAETLKDVRSVQSEVPDAEWTKVEGAPTAVLVTFLWNPSDAGGLGAAYALAAQIAALPRTWTVASDVDRLESSQAWSDLATDAAAKPLRAPQHFVNQLYPEDDGSLTIETVGTARFGLRPLSVDHLTRAAARPMGRMVNILVQRWVEGQRPARDGTLTLALAELVHPEAKKEALGSQVGKSPGRLRIKPVLVGEAADAVAQLEFPDATGTSNGERQDAALDQLFGSADSTQNVDHTAELLDVSRRSRERLLRELKPRVLKGLPAGEVLLVKAPFECIKGTEWMWVDVQAWKGSQITGSLQSQPDCAVELRAGQSVTVKEGVLFDYMDKSLDGTFVGNDTGKLMQPDLFEELDGGRRRIRD